MKIETDLDGAWFGVPVGVVAALILCFIACAVCADRRRDEVRTIQQQAVDRGLGRWTSEQSSRVAAFQWIEPQAVK